MKAAEIANIWPSAVKARISAKAHLPSAPTLVLGFDTEYLTPAGDYQPSVPVCWQWHDGQRGAVMPLHGQKLKMSDLSEVALTLAEDRDPQARHIVFASWFALAELSVIDLDMAHRLLSHGSGAYGAQWKVVMERGKHKKKVTYTLTIFDLTALYGRQSLAKASASLPVPKKSWDHSRTTLDSVRDPEFRDYALHDAHLCYLLAKELHDEFSLAWGAHPFEMVSAGYMASALFRYHYVSKDLMQPHPEVRRMALIAYRGSGDYGGCYAPGIYDGEYAEYDAVSMYPASAALLGKLPRRNDWRPWDAEAFQGDWIDEGIYRAQIDWPEGETRRTLLAQVPTPHGDERFEYPQTAVDVWTGFELRAAVRAGCRVRVSAGWYYENGTDAFPRFLEHTARKRQTVAEKAGKPWLSPVYKNVGNTAIGKLGQHRAHAVYEAVYNPDTDRMEYAPAQETRQGLGGIFAPEWWVLIVGYARAAMMDVIRERQALHAQVDAVLLPDCGEQFEHAGLLFRRKSSGDRLKLAARNLWTFERGGEVVRFAAGGNGRDLPELREVMRAWTGEAVSHPYTVTDLVTLPQHAADPEGHPLLSRSTTSHTFKIPALPEVQHVGIPVEASREESGADAGRGGDVAGAPRAARAVARESGNAGRRAGRAERGGGAGNDSSPLGRGGRVKLLVVVEGKQGEITCKRSKVGIHRAVLKVQDQLGYRLPEVAAGAAEAILAGFSAYNRTAREKVCRVEVID